jgi:predicted enzyme related to lactoylglutathione lyase
MKNINGTKKIAIKAGTADGAFFGALIEHDKGAKKLLIDTCVTAYLMSDGAIIEIYGIGFSYPEYLFKYGNLVVSFKVESIESMLSDLEQNGATLLGQVENICSSYRFCHILTPEKTVIGLFEHPELQKL